MAELIEKVDGVIETDNVMFEGEKVVENSQIEEPMKMIKYDEPVIVKYCPNCTMPPEYCEYGADFATCLPWILSNCPEVLSETVLAAAMKKASLGENSDQVDLEKDLKKKPRGGGAAPLKKATVVETKIFIARVQRQKRKFVTVVTGLETIPDLKIKDAARVFGKKFSSGASVGESATGVKEVVIQGDVSYDLPSVLMNEFKVYRPSTTVRYIILVKWMESYCRLLHQVYSSLRKGEVSDPSDESHTVRSAIHDRVHPTLHQHFFSSSYSSDDPLATTTTSP